MTGLLARADLHERNEKRSIPQVCTTHETLRLIATMLVNHFHLTYKPFHIKGAFKGTRALPHPVATPA